MKAGACPVVALTMDEREGGVSKIPKILQKSYVHGPYVIS